MFLLLDIGGTNTRLATATNSEKFITLEKFSTPATFSAALSALTTSLDQLKLTTIDGTYIGLPGVIDTSTGKLIHSPNLPGWKGQVIRQPLEKITGSIVSIVNDSALAGLGEACHGAGQGFDIVAYLTISTGVGGARIVNGKIDSFTHGFEPGSQIIDASGHLCPDCHHPSSLENLVGGASVAKRFGCHPKEIKDPAVWTSLAKWLAFGLSNITALWSPSVIVLGGPMMKDIPLDQVINHTTGLTTFAPQPPAIKPASLGDDRAFYGALTLLKNTYNK
jgi:glucokinase